MPYLFSKVESRRVFDMIITRVTKAVDRLVAHIPYKFRDEEERTHYENLLILQAAIKDLPSLAEQQKFLKNHRPRKIFKPNLHAHVRSPGRSPMMSSKHSRSPTLSGKIQVDVVEFDRNGDTTKNEKAKSQFTFKNSLHNTHNDFLNQKLLDPVNATIVDNSSDESERSRNQLPLPTVGRVPTAQTSTKASNTNSKSLPKNDTLLNFASQMEVKRGLPPKGKQRYQGKLTNHMAMQTWKDAPRIET